MEVKGYTQVFLTNVSFPNFSCWQISLDLWGGVFFEKNALVFSQFMLRPASIANKFKVYWTKLIHLVLVLQTIMQLSAKQRIGIGGVSSLPWSSKFGPVRLCLPTFFLFPPFNDIPFLIFPGLLLILSGIYSFWVFLLQAFCWNVSYPPAFMAKTSIYLIRQPQFV